MNRFNTGIMLISRNIIKFLISNIDINTFCYVVLCYKMSMLVMVWFLSICMSLWIKLYSCNGIWNKFCRMIEKDTKVAYIIYFSKLLVICFGVSVLQIFSTTFVSLGVHICFCGRAQKKPKRTCFDITKKTTVAST